MSAQAETGRWDRFAAHKLVQLLAVAAALLQARMQAEMPDVSCAEAKAAAPRMARTFVNRIVRRGECSKVVVVVTLTVVREQRVGHTHVEFDLRMHAPWWESD